MNIKKFFLLTLTSASILAGCGPTSNPTSEEQIQQKASEVNVVLNLTSIGLYNGNKGTANESLFLENTVSLTLEVGAKLPSTEITSTSKDVEFKTWIYYDKGGILSSTDAVVAGITEYQAHFEYKGEFDNGGNNTETTSNKVYFISQSWWQKDNSTTSIYYWGNMTTSWPGIVMHLEETLSNGRKVWSYEIDLSLLTGLIFSRTSAGALEGSSGTDWGAKTPDLSPSQFSGTNNCVVMTSTTEQWGDPGVNYKVTTYVPGKTDY